MTAVVLNFPAMRAPSNRVKEYRKAAGLTQEALAERLGTSNIVISQLESGRTRLSHQWMARIADALDLDNPADLLGEELSKDSLAPDERRLVTLYRAADETRRAQIMGMAELLVPDAKAA